MAATRTFQKWWDATQCRELHNFTSAEGNFATTVTTKTKVSSQHIGNFTTTVSKFVIELGNFNAITGNFTTVLDKFSVVTRNFKKGG
jgi:hypothetical protein